MNVSVAAIVTDVTRDSRPVIGYGFNSNGRYAQSEVLRHRLIPRILEVNFKTLLDNNGNLDPFKV